MMDVGNFDKQFTNIVPIDSPVNSLDKIGSQVTSEFGLLLHNLSCSIKIHLLAC